jgi:hypothetical protein
MTALFLLRVDSATGNGEGEVYFIKKLGITTCNLWNSPKLTDHQVIIANGRLAIDEVYDQYSSYHITQFKEN